jgi:hypothetical protein
MRIRAEDANGDYTLGLGDNQWLVNSPAAVALAIHNALNMWQGQYFANLLLGVAWATQVLGFNSSSLYDAVIRNAISGVQGVESIVSYSSTLKGRALTVTARVQTIYNGAITISETLSGGFGVGPFGIPAFGS